MKLVIQVVTDGQDFDIRDSAAQFRRQKTKLLDIEARLPDLIDTKVLTEYFPIIHSDCISLLINAEVTKYNNLLKYLKAQVEVLQGCLDGDTTQGGPALEQTMKCILIDETPTDWLLKSFPSSQSLPSFLGNLQERVDYINEIMDSERPRLDLWAFWLPGLFDQAHFFTALVQQQARRLKLPLDSLNISYTVSDLALDCMDNAAISDSKQALHDLIRKNGQPEEGVWYIYGL